LRPYRTQTCLAFLFASKDLQLQIRLLRART